MSKHIIYRIYCVVTKKCYVGVTVNRKSRKRSHFNALKNKYHHSAYLQNAYNKYGRKAFVFEVIETSLSRDDAYVREVAWIDFYDSYYNGYNMTKGGDSGNPNVLGTPVEWNGVRYESMREAARTIGISAAAMQWRLSSGYKCDTDMVGRGSSLSTTVTWNGVEYGSLRKAASANGISAPTMLYRLNQGYVCDSDMTGRGNSLRQSSKRWAWNGITYPTVKDAAKALGISTFAFRYRIKQGYTCDDDMK